MSRAESLKTPVCTAGSAWLLFWIFPKGQEFACGTFGGDQVNEPLFADFFFEFSSWASTFSAAVVYSGRNMAKPRNLLKLHYLLRAPSIACLIFLLVSFVALCFAHQATCRKTAVVFPRAPDSSYRVVLNRSKSKLKFFDC